MVQSHREKSPYSELFRSTFSCILSISLYPVQMWENTDQINSQYGHFLHCE